MVLIRCPHCGEDVELEDGVFGLFACPYCDEEFNYESGISSGLNATMKVGFGLLFGSIIAILLGFILLNGAINGFTDSAESTECDKGPWIDSLIDPPECSSDGDWGLGSLCGGIILILIGIGVGISAFVSLLTGQLVVIKK
tara:strand:+ start:1000 stop:1422 length:423 start_codon:yes stop_codon:yes gene_type:complete